MDNITIRAIIPTDVDWIKRICDEEWGGEPLVIRGKKFFPTTLPGLIAEHNSKIVGVLFYSIEKNDCEIILLESFVKFAGIGTLLIEKLKAIAKQQRCVRIFLMTNNDNLDALRFYQRRGFVIYAIHIDSVKISRKIKPSIGYTGDYGIPIRDEIDLEFKITDGE